MGDGENLKSLTVDIKPRNIDYNVSAYLTNNDDQLVIEIRETDTLNSWKGVYDSNYIEDLTRKTGNYKAFPIFVNMLHTAMKNDSNTVSLDIMTYNDLEAIRNKKTSMNNTLASSASKGPNSFSNLNDNKRFLILNYNVEFDRINYPLQLTYQGKADVNYLLETIEKLKFKIKSLESKNRIVSPEMNSSKSLELIRLEKENELLKQEKDALKLLIKQREQDGVIGEENIQSNVRNVNNQLKDIKLLKQIIKTLEEKSMKEKNMYQKQLIKKKQEIDILRDQLSEKKIIETNLKNEIRILSNEIKLSRSRRSSSSIQRRSSSQDSIKRASLVINRDGSNSRSNGYFTNPNPSSNIIRRRPDRSVSPSPSLINNRKSSASPCSSIGSYRSNSVNKKFNPTEYINQKKSKLKEIELRKQTDIRKRINSGGSNSNLNRSGSNLSIASNNSLDTNSVYSLLSNSSQRRQDKLSINNKMHQNNRRSFCQNDQDDYDRYETPSGFNQESNKFNHFDIYNREKEMKEIDLKLKSLQLLIKNNI